jgi:hypothetical protein
MEAEETRSVKAVVVTIDVQETGHISFGVSDVTELSPPSEAVAECEAEIAKGVCGHMKFHMRRIMAAAQKEIDAKVKLKLVEGTTIEGCDPPEKSMLIEEPEA